MLCLFTYIIIIFSPKRRYILCNKKFFFLLIEKFLKLELESNLNNWAKCCSDLSLKKKMHCFKGKEVILFLVKQPCHRTAGSNFILSMFSREIYLKFYVVFTTYKNAKIKKLLERYSVKKYFWDCSLTGFYFSLFFCSNSQSPPSPRKFEQAF